MNYPPIKAILVLDRRVTSSPARKIIEDRRVDCQLLDVEEFLTDIEADDRALYTKLALRELGVVLLDPSLPSAFLMKTATRVRDKPPSLPVLVLSQSGPTLLIADAIRQVCNREQLNSNLLQLALKDELTSLHNRRGFAMLADEQLKVARNLRRSLLLFFADVDGLKRINDTFGHEAGDEAIVLAATCFRKSFRNADVIARIGGDEFVALTSEESNSSLDTIWRRLQRNIAMHNGVRRPYKLSLSLGVARFDPGAAVSLKELMAQADRALYAQRQRAVSGSAAGARAQPGVAMNGYALSLCEVPP